LQPDTPAYKALLEQLEKLDGETIRDRNKLLDTLQRLMNGEELKEGETDVTTGSENANSDSKADTLQGNEINAEKGKKQTQQTNTAENNDKQTDLVKKETTNSEVGIGEKTQEKETDAFIKEEAKLKAFETAPATSEKFKPLGFTVFTKSKIPAINDTFYGVVTVYYIDDGIKKYYRISEDEVLLSVAEKGSTYYVFLLVNGATVELDNAKHIHYFKINHRLIVNNHEITRG
jgi:hypothetical protein